MGVSHCACLVKTHRLICNMIFLSQHVITLDLDLRSNIDLVVHNGARIELKVLLA